MDLFTEDEPHFQNRTFLSTLSQLTFRFTIDH